MDSLMKEASNQIDNPKYSKVKEGLEKVFTEIVTARGRELHNVASLTGGMVS